MYVNPADMFMTRQKEILITESIPEQLLKIFQMTGAARSAVHPKMILKKNKLFRKKHI